MSKRFGRNQKRKLLAELDAHKEALTLQTELAKYLRKQGQRDAETVKRVAQVLGRHFAALEPTEVSTSMKLARLKMPTVMPMQETERDELAQEVQWSLTELEIAWFELRGNDLANQAHAYIRGPGPLDVGYAVSDTALRSTPPEWIADNVARGMQRFLETALMKEQAK